MTTATFFVYGTLKAGQRNEHWWPVRPLRIEPAWVLGRLFGRSDYPAMVAGDDRVLGEIWWFREAQSDEVLVALDRLEGTNQPGEVDLYQRQSVAANSLQGRLLGAAMTYWYANDPVQDGFRYVRPDANGYATWQAESW
ncbi:MAG: gamma-glutamylcyclotransferase family protein [Planctomycetota bacterium]